MIEELISQCPHEDRWMVFRCPVCEPTRRKKGQLCLSINRGRGWVKCHHPDCELNTAKRCAHFTGEEDAFTPSKIEIEKDYEPLDFMEIVASRGFSGLTEEHVQYLNSRGISHATAALGNVWSAMPWITSRDGESHQRPALAFVTRWDGDVLDVNYKTTDKEFTAEKGYTPFLWNLDSCVDRDFTLIHEDLIITEGMLDALTFMQVGLLNVVSLPKGAGPGVGKLKCFDSPIVQEVIKNCKRIILALDHDKNGQITHNNIVSRLGAEKLWEVHYPAGCKDANEVLTKLGPSAVLELYTDATLIPLFGVKAIPELALEMEALLASDDALSGLSTGWGAMDNIFRLVTGNLVIFTAVPGFGKTTWLNALCVNAFRLHGWPSAFFSPEAGPARRHGLTLAQNWIGKSINNTWGDSNKLTQEDLGKFISDCGNAFHFVEPEIPTLSKILDAFRDVVARYGVKICILDPYNHVMPESNTSGIDTMRGDTYALNTMRDFAKKHDVLFVLVAHPKLVNKYQNGDFSTPGMMDIFGGSVMATPPDCIIAANRCFSQPDGYVHFEIAKTRDHTVYKPAGRATLFFNEISTRYTEAYGNPVVYE